MQKSLDEAEWESVVLPKISLGSFTGQDTQVFHETIHLGYYIEVTQPHHKFPNYEVYDFKGDYRYLILQPEYIVQSMVQFLLEEAREWATRKTT